MDRRHTSYTVYTTRLIWQWTWRAFKTTRPTFIEGQKWQLSWQLSIAYYYCYVVKIGLSCSATTIRRSAILSMDVPQNVFAISFHLATCCYCCRRVSPVGSMHRKHASFVVFASFWRFFGVIECVFTYDVVCTDISMIWKSKNGS